MPPPTNGAPLPQAFFSRLLRRSPWVLLVALALVLSACLAGNVAAPKAQGGVLDLSAWDLPRQGPLRLAGEWEVRWGQLLTPQEFAASGQRAELAHVPGPWSKTRPGQELFSSTGAATYRLALRRDQGFGGMALHLGGISSAWRLWADGRLVAECGTPGLEAALETVRLASTVVPLGLAGEPQGRNELMLVLQVSNHHFRDGGVLGAPMFGPAEALQEHYGRRAALALCLAGALLIMGVYHVGLFYFRRSGPAPLLFGVYCLLWLGNYVSTDSSDWVVRQLLPRLPGVGLERFGLACLFLSVPVGYAFFRSLYPGEFRRALLHMAAWAGAVLAALALGGPSQWLGHALPLFYLFTALLIVYCFARLLRAWRRGLEGAAFILAGFCAIGLAGLNDMLTDLALIASVPLVAPGMLVFIMSQAFALSWRLSRAFTAVEALSSQLESKNQSLEAEMAERNRLEREVINISEEERRRMSVDLHDGLCQLLTAARLRCAVLTGMPRSAAEKEDLAKLSGLLDRLVDQAYDLSIGLWPLEHEATGPSLADLAQRFSRSSGVPIGLTQQWGCRSCPDGKATQFFRIAQEALSNAVKHAKPTRIELFFCCEPGGQACLRVSDDGVGRAAAKRSKGGLGMGIMVHRARIIGGELRVEDAPGGGTVVSCTAACEVLQEGRPGGAPHNTDAATEGKP